MLYKEIKMNLFDCDSKYYFAQCISLDCAMGKGIAKTFLEKEPNMKRELLNVIDKANINVPHVILYKNVFNLITKKKFNDKPTYYTLYECIKQMKEICINNNINHIATYKLGCTRDRLNWNEVKFMIENEFKDTDIEIIISI